MQRHTVLAIAIASLALLGSAGAQQTSAAVVPSAREQPQGPAAADGLSLDAVRRGWHFFDDPDPDTQAPEERTPAPREQSRSDTKPAGDIDDLRRFEAMQKQLKDYRKIAVQNPTDRNVRRYMEMENRVFRMAGRFSDVSQRVAWSTPELDMSLQGRPINARAIDVFDKVQASQRQDAIAALAKSHVLFFFFRSDCPYCHAFSPTLRAFEDKSGIKVVPVSLDGRGLPAYPEPRRDNGIATTLQVTQVPALYLAEPSSGKITPIGFGILSESQLAERISTVSAPGAEATLPSATRRIRLQ